MRHDGEHVQHMMQDIYGFAPERIAMRSQVYQKFQASDFDLGSDRALLDWAGKQTYIALGNMMTAAAMIGIDSCPIEGFESEGAEQILANAGVFDRADWSLAVMVAFGYRIKPQSAKVRRPATEVVRWIE